MSKELETDVLKGVSRSFYLSLRFLPSAMRRPASIAYLLARLSDTIADSVSASADERLSALEHFSQQVKGEVDAVAIPESLIDGAANSSEKRLLRESVLLIAAMNSLAPEQQFLIQEVIDTITSGQRLDIERFELAEGGAIRVLSAVGDLDDYTWRVAGCVGLFWTRLGFLTMGAKFSNRSQDELEDLAVEYGKGLQLVNILRDLPEDLRAGRCYLPVNDPTDDVEVFAQFRHWREMASQKISYGRQYSEALRTKRLRVASVMPAAIGELTLCLLDVASLDDLQPRVKVSRKSVYRILLREIAFG